MFFCYAKHLLFEHYIPVLQTSFQHEVLFFCSINHQSFFGGLCIIILYSGNISLSILYDNTLLIILGTVCLVFEYCTAIHRYPFNYQALLIIQEIFKFFNKMSISTFSVLIKKG